MSEVIQQTKTRCFGFNYEKFADSDYQRPMPGQYESLIQPIFKEINSAKETSNLESMSIAMRMLLCAEESAFCIFMAESIHAKDSLPPKLAFELIRQFRRISWEEDRHAIALGSLISKLPIIDDSQNPTRMARKIFLKIQHRDPKIHFQRIAELDRTACIIINSIIKSEYIKKNFPEMKKLLRLITTEEASHIRTSKLYVEKLGGLSEEICERESIVVVTELTKIMKFVEFSFESLGIDTGEIQKNLNRRSAFIYGV